MALYAAIGAEFKRAILSELDALVEERLKRVITQTLKQVAHDYSLNYKDLKTRYCASAPPPAPALPPSVPAPPTPPQVAPVAAVPPAPAGPQVPSAAAGPPAPAVPPESQLAMSKMKKRDLELECERRGLCPDGTISELKERVKHARLLEKPAKKARKPKDPNAPKKERKKSPSPPAASSASGAPATSAAPVAPGAPLKAPRPLEIEDDDVDLDDADEFEKEFDEEDDQGETMQSRIRRLLAEHGEELDEDDDFADA